jgi:hypothetical protein
MDKHIVIEQKCVSCDSNVAIRVAARVGSASHGSWPFTCPKCKTEQGEMPGPVIDSTLIED